MIELQPPPLLREQYTADISQIMARSTLEQLERVSLATLLEAPVYRLVANGYNAEVYHAATGERLSPIDRATAIALAE